MGAMWWRKRGRDLFRDHELAVIDLVGSQLDEPGRGLLEGQIAATGMIQRMFDDTDVMLYPSRSRAGRHDRTLDFPNRATELRLATVRLEGPLGTGKVVVHVVMGQIFELTFTPSPKKLGDRRAIRTTGLTMHADPMVPDDGAAARQRLEALEDATRAEYETLIAAQPGKSDLLGIDELYAIQLDDGEYLMLAQLDDTSFVVAPTHPPRPGVRRYWPDGDPNEDYATIRAALERRS